MWLKLGLTWFFKQLGSENEILNVLAIFNLFFFIIILYSIYLYQTVHLLKEVTKASPKLFLPFFAVYKHFETIKEKGEKEIFLWGERIKDSKKIEVDSKLSKSTVIV